MVKIMEHQTLFFLMDDLGGLPPIFLEKHPYKFNDPLNPTPLDSFETFPVSPKHPRNGCIVNGALDARFGGGASAEVTPKGSEK